MHESQRRNTYKCSKTTSSCTLEYSHTHTHTCLLRTTCCLCEKWKRPQGLGGGTSESDIRGMSRALGPADSMSTWTTSASGKRVPGLSSQHGKTGRLRVHERNRQSTPASKQTVSSESTQSWGPLSVRQTSGS